MTVTKDLKSGWDTKTFSIVTKFHTLNLTLGGGGGGIVSESGGYTELTLYFE